MNEQDFMDELKEIDLLRQALAILEWDMQTGMPQKAGSARGDVMGYLTKLSFEKEVSPKIKAFIDYFSSHAEELSEVGKAAFAKVKEEYERTHAVPAGRMQAYSKAVSMADSAWQQGREAQDFNLFKEALETNIRFTKEFIPLWRREEKTPYDVLLNLNEPGMTTEVLDKVFSELLEGIQKLRKDLEKGTVPRHDFLGRKVPKTQQERFVREVISQLGYDFSRGRLDDTIHPFMTGINPDDARLTTRWNEDDFTVAVFGTIHEAGHGMYEQHIDKKFAGTPLYAGASMGIHESQSLFNELIIGSHPAFWKKQYPFFQECTEGTFADIDFETFYKGLHTTHPSLIRIEADSLTYPIHIIIRYEIEKMIFNGEADTADLPKIWNQKYEEYLGVRPENDTEGILQDVHWAGGSFGYFPSYALGYMYAAQLYHRMAEEIDISEMLEKGGYSAIQNWLTKNIHQFGASRKPNQLIKDAAGEDLNPKYLLDYLKQLYYPVYGLKEDDRQSYGSKT